MQCEQRANYILDCHLPASHEVFRNGQSGCAAAKWTSGRQARLPSEAVMREEVESDGETASGSGSSNTGYLDPLLFEAALHEKCPVFDFSVQPLCPLCLCGEFS